MSIPHSSKIFLTLAATFALTALAAAQSNPRLGKWKLKQDAPPPALNIMTYEPYLNGGMRVTVEATNAQGRTNKWTYVTMFDGKDEPVTGDTRTETTAVKKIDDRTNEIVNKRGGKVMQIITNVLSADGKRIDNTYQNFNEQGEKTTTTKAVYEKIE